MVFDTGAMFRQQRRNNTDELYQVAQEAHHPLGKMPYCLSVTVVAEQHTVRGMSA